MNSPIDFTLWLSSCMEVEKSCDSSEFWTVLEMFAKTLASLICNLYKSTPPGKKDAQENKIM